MLNAKYHEREAEIVAQAGRKGAVTIATNMAGRGTDILLGGNPEFMAREMSEGMPAIRCAAKIAGRRPDCNLLLQGNESPFQTSGPNVDRYKTER